jgi:hypothetical protein
LDYKWPPPSFEAWEEELTKGEDLNATIAHIDRELAKGPPLFVESVEFSPTELEHWATLKQIVSGERFLKGTP